jgi:hypothetical protein
MSSLFRPKLSSIFFNKPGPVNRRKFCITTIDRVLSFIIVRLFPKYKVKWLPRPLFLSMRTVRSLSLPSFLTILINSLPFIDYTKYRTNLSVKQDKNVLVKLCAYDLLVLTNGRIIEKQPQIIPREMGGERRKVQGEKKDKRAATGDRPRFFSCKSWSVPCCSPQISNLLIF